MRFPQAIALFFLAGTGLAIDDHALRGLKGNGPPNGMPEQAQGEPQNPNPVASLDLPSQSKVDFYEPVDGLLIMSAMTKEGGPDLLDSYEGEDDPASIYKFLSGSDVIPGALRAAIARSRNKDYGDETTDSPPEGSMEESGDVIDNHDRRHRDLGISKSTWINSYCTGKEYEISDTNCRCWTFRTGGAYWQSQSAEVFMRAHAYDGGLQQRIDWWNNGQWQYLNSDWIPEGYIYERRAWRSTPFWWKLSINYATNDIWHSFWHKRDAKCCYENGQCIKPLTCLLEETCPNVL